MRSSHSRGKWPSMKIEIGQQSQWKIWGAKVEMVTICLLRFAPVSIYKDTDCSIWKNMRLVRVQLLNEGIHLGRTRRKWMIVFRMETPKSSFLAVWWSMHWGNRTTPTVGNCKIQWLFVCPTSGAQNGESEKKGSRHLVWKNRHPENDLRILKYLSIYTGIPIEKLAMQPMFPNF